MVLELAEDACAEDAEEDAARSSQGLEAHGVALSHDSEEKLLRETV